LNQTQPLTRHQPRCISTRPQPTRTDERHFSAATHTPARNPRAGAGTRNHTKPLTRFHPRFTLSRPHTIKPDERHVIAFAHTLARNSRAGADTPNHTQPHTRHQPRCTPTRPQPIKTDERYDSATPYNPRATHVQEPILAIASLHVHASNDSAVSHDPPASSVQLRA
jgi:hypothetical protein